MEIIGLIVVSCVLMLFNGGIVGVILLWAWVAYKANEKQKNIAKYNKAKEEFRRKNGYNYPGYM